MPEFSSPSWWLAAAAALAALELLAPGFFLIWVAGAAALTGVIALALPFGISIQFLLFAVLAVIAVLLGRRMFGGGPITSEDPLLNDRLGRLIGEVVTVVEPISGGTGRVKVADSPWPAAGPDLPAGAKVRIVGMDGTTLRVEPVA